MKYIIISILLFINWELYAQTNYINHNPQALNVGQEMPDIELSYTKNGIAYKTKMSELRGKLVIFDFWSTGCPTCIAAFPKMERLQKIFGDKIQIFIVNAKESQDQMENRLRMKRISNFKWPDLPSITGAKHFQTFFPHIVVPHHVWIDQKGIVRVIGASCNTYEEKINEILQDKSVSYMRNDNNALFENDCLIFDDSRLLYNSISNKTRPIVRYSSFFTLYNNYIHPFGICRQNLFDSISQTKRNTYINLDARELYLHALREHIQPTLDKRIFGLGSSYFKTGNACALLVKDTLSCTGIFTKDKTDKHFMANQFCYEQIVPGTIDEKEIRRRMLQDLNDFFGDLLGIEGSVEKIKMPCYVLIIKNDKLIINANRSISSEIYNDSIVCKNTSLKSAIETVFSRFSRVNNWDDFLILDETNSGETIVNMVFPKWKEGDDINLIKKSLNKYGLDLILTERPLDLIVIKDKSKL